jgi:hypothetical protein
MKANNRITLCSLISAGFVMGMYYSPEIGTAIAPYLESTPSYAKYFSFGFSYGLAAIFAGRAMNIAYELPKERHQQGL